VEIGIYPQVFILHKIFRVVNPRQCLTGLALCLVHVSALAVSQINITAEHFSHPQIEANNVVLQLELAQESFEQENLEQENIILKLHSQAKLQAFKDPANISLACRTTPSMKKFDCEDGLIKNPQLHIPFSIKINQLFEKGALDSQGDLRLKNMRFSDTSGLHAAENIDATVNFSLAKQGEQFAWQTHVNWVRGELFWQPYFLEGGHSLTARGSIQHTLMTISQADLSINKVGAMHLDGVLDISQKKVLALNAGFPNIHLDSAYALLFKPNLENTAFNHAQINGQAALNFTVKNHALVASNLQLKDVNIVDNNGKFAFYQLNASIPWSYETAEKIQLSYQNGMLLNMPLGAANIAAEVNRYAVTAPTVHLPILDGALNLSDISAARIGNQWYWHLRANLTPVSMADFTQALKLPRMSGQASAEIPLVTYSDGVLTNDGQLLLNIFNGSATLNHLVLQNPLGESPKLFADLTLRNLDLGDLTRTFSFGAIEGKLDGDISNLEMQNWKPIKFDASVKSSPGKYPKKISQRAVENISALGGAGAAAAIQRSVLRFFEQFHYEKLGLSCQLRHDVCKMAGVESTAHGYIIVKGSGIPAITVMGYNETVGWGDLLARIKRVIEGNTKAVIK
jgi:hypothetical protein